MFVYRSERYNFIGRHARKAFSETNAIFPKLLFLSILSDIKVRHCRTTELLLRNVTVIFFNVNQIISVEHKRCLYTRSYSLFYLYINTTLSESVMKCHLF